MGIKRLNNFLEKCDALQYYDNINDYIKKSKTGGFQQFSTRNEKYVVGIDFLLYAYKYKYSCKNILIGFINQILNFLNNKIIPVYVIDGLAPEEKINTINYRNNKKERNKTRISDIENEISNSNNFTEKKELNDKLLKLKKSNINISSNEIKLFIELLDILNIKYMRADGEADVLLVKLFKENIINACLSEDMDLLVFGCKDMIKFKSSKIINYNLDIILEKLDLSHEQFVELSILFGCDYLKPMIKERPEVIYGKYIKNKNLECLLDNLNSEYLDNFYKVKKLFLDISNCQNVNLDLKMNLISEDRLITFIKKYCNERLDIFNIKQSVSFINSMIRSKKI